MFADLLREVDACLSPPIGLPATDVVADLLGFLAGRMTELHEARQGERRRFYQWLEDQLGAPIDAMTQKAAIRDYYSAPGVEALLDAIARNYPRRATLDIRKPRRYGATNQARQRVIDGYETSMATLRPILEQIRLTDALIDEIVYRLYGLSNGEIAVVEGSFTPALETAD